jgi:hypothetical protein
MAIQLLAAGNDPMQWIVYAMGMLIIIYLVIRPLTKKKDPLAGVPKYSLSQQRGVEREMSSILVELSNMARQVTAQIDTRAAKLEALIQDADQRIAELKQLETSAKNSLLQASIGRELHLRDDLNSLSSIDEAKPNSRPPDPRYVEIYSLADTGRSTTEIAQQLNRPRGEIELILALRAR